MDWWGAYRRGGLENIDAPDPADDAYLDHLLADDPPLQVTAVDVATTINRQQWSVMSNAVLSAYDTLDVTVWIKGTAGLLPDPGQLLARPSGLPDPPHLVRLEQPDGLGGMRVTEFHVKKIVMRQEMR